MSKTRVKETGRNFQQNRNGILIGKTMTPSPDNNPVKVSGSPTVADSATDQAETIAAVTSALNGAGLTPVLTCNNRQKDGQS